MLGQFTNRNYPITDFKLINQIQTFNNPGKNGVVTIEVDIISVIKEKLTTSGIFA